MFPVSVAENIAYGNPAAGFDEIEAASRAANAHGFICKLPKGYNTIVGEGGATLSGGERQRISIARALRKNAPLLILDEPTSALDTEAERALLQAFKRLMHGRTTLVIAHRLSTIRESDSIAVMKQVVLWKEARMKNSWRPKEFMLGFTIFKRPKKAKFYSH